MLKGWTPPPDWEQTNLMLSFATTYVFAFASSSCLGTQDFTLLFYSPTVLMMGKKGLGGHLMFTQVQSITVPFDAQHGA